MEVSFDKLSLVDAATIHFEFAVAMIPSLLVLSLVFVFKLARHLLISYK